MERLAGKGGTGEQGRVCKVYLKEKELLTEPGGKGWHGSGDEMKRLKVDKRTFLVHVCSTWKHIVKGSWGECSRPGGCTAPLGKAQHPRGAGRARGWRASCTMKFSRLRR